MWRTLFIVLAVAVCLAADLPHSNVPSSQPATKASTQPTDAYHLLVARLPTTFTGDPEIKSFDVTGLLYAPDLPLMFHFRQSAPGKTVAYVEFANRHVPLGLMVDGEVLLYDPANGVARRLHDAAFSCTFEVKDESAGLQFNLCGRKDAEPHLTFDLNLRSIMESTPFNLSTTSEGNLAVITGTSKKGNPIRYWMDTSRAMPLSHMAMAMDRKPLLAITSIHINEPIDESGMRMPSDEELTPVLPVVDDKKTFINQAAWMGGAALTCVYESAFENPTLREGVEKKIGKMNWESRIKMDNEIGAKLKLLIDRPAATQPSTRSIERENVDQRVLPLE
ncbi:hypothetical protein BH10PLA1_BH10PLA1_15570 [soil metagenome]